MNFAPWIKSLAYARARISLLGAGEHIDTVNGRQTMFERLAHWVTRYMWREINDPSALYGPVLLTWRGATGPARHRMGVYRYERKFEGEDYGDGFVCWWSGRPLTDTMTHWAPPPLTPNVRANRANDGATGGA